MTDPAAGFAARLFGIQTEQPVQVEQPELAETEGLPPRDKPVSEWSEQESDAFLADADRRMARILEQRLREEREQEARIRAEAMLTPHQEHGYLIASLGDPAVKRALNEEWVRRLHPDPP